MAQAAEVDPLPELPEDDDEPEEDEPDEDVDPEDVDPEDDEEPVDGVLEVEDSFGVLLLPELSEEEDVLRESLR